MAIEGFLLGLAIALPIGFAMGLLFGRFEAQRLRLRCQEDRLRKRLSELGIESEEV